MKKLIGIALLVITLGIGMSLLIAFPFMWCWNYAATHAFGAPEIGWGHAFCLLALTYLVRFKVSGSRSEEG